MNHKALAWVLALAGGTAARLQCQIASVSGSLVNHESRAPVEGARVSIVGTELNASSDAQGRFRVSGVPAGVRVMQVHAIGFAVGSWVVELGDGQALNQVFELAPRALEVAGVDVSAPGAENWRSEAGFEARRSRGTGFFLTTADIQQRSATSITELLRTVPGLLTTCGSRTGGGNTGCVIRMARSTTQCTPDYFLDGYFATNSTGPTFPIQQIRAVEVYRDRFETPAEFQMPNQQCGVVAIWTVDPGARLLRH